MLRWLKDLFSKSPIEIWDHAIACFLLALQEKRVATLHNGVLVSAGELQQLFQGPFEPQV